MIWCRYGAGGWDANYAGTHDLCGGLGRCPGVDDPARGTSESAVVFCHVVENDLIWPS